MHMAIPIAVKILHPSLTTNEIAVKRFYREARLALTIKHPNAVSMLDLGVIEDTTLYLIMEYISGTSLHTLIKVEGFTLERSISLMKQICKAVEAAHQQNIIHRDLKPGNIIIINPNQPNELAKVIDFSIAKSISNEDGEIDLTGSDIIIGTPEYLSPEQAQGHKIDTRTDIYSLGIIMYQMVTGELPYKASTAASWVLSHIHRKPIPIKKFKEGISPEVEQAIMCALEKEPDKRPQTASEFITAIENAAAAHPAQAASAPGLARIEKAAGVEKVELKAVKAPSETLNMVVPNDEALNNADKPTFENTMENILAADKDSEVSAKNEAAKVETKSKEVAIDEVNTPTLIVPQSYQDLKNSDEGQQFFQQEEPLKTVQTAPSDANKARSAPPISAQKEDPIKPPQSAKPNEEELSFWQKIVKAIQSIFK